MKNQKDIATSKLYCNRCGSFDLMKLNRGLVAKYIFDEPKKLHCQSCDAKLNFQKIASNPPLTLPSFYTESDSTLYEKTSLPNSQWFLFLKGVFGGLALFGVLISLVLMLPHPRVGNINAEVYLEPITRLGEVETIRLDTTKNKNADMEVALLEDPKKAPDDLVWEEVGGRVNGLSRKAVPELVEPVLIQEDVVPVTPQEVVTIKEESPPDLVQPIQAILQDLDRLLKN